MSTSPYHQAGKLMQQILVERKSIKTVAFAKSKLVCSKATYAQVCNTIQHKKVIDSILNYNGGKLKKSIEMEKARSQGLVYVLIYEMLFGKYRSIRGGGKIKRSIMKFEKEFKQTKAAVVKDHDVKACQNEIPVFPRYVRVNKLKASVEEVVKALKKEMTSQASDEDGNHDIYQDAHVPDLLVLSPNAPITWHESELSKSGKIILQDKSSCFSALALVHGRQYESNSQILHGDYIDATAAPGNKTSHLAALVYDDLTFRKEKNKKRKNNVAPTKVFAFDRSSTRVTILKDRLLNLAPSVVLNNDELKRNSKKNDFPVDVCPRHEDFLKVDPCNAIYKDVRSILLDPSCSGSGIVNSPDRFADATSNTEKEENRIESLSNFQLVALKHAMSFPQCMRIVYSTCSVNKRENEDVVEAAMTETNEGLDDDDMKWELVSPMALQNWHRRGLAMDALSKEQSECLVRVNGMDGDDTNGFFVSYFERRKVSKQISSSKPKDLINVQVDGLKGIYSGEFRLKTATGESKSSDNFVKDKTFTDSSKLSVTKATTAEKNIAAKADMKKDIPKKIGKKLLWKQKQKELKLARVQKKKLASLSNQS